MAVARGRIWIALLLFACVDISFRTSAAAADEVRSTLVLLPGQPGQPVASAIAAGIRSVLVPAWSTRITIETEHVDVSRFAGSDYEEHLRDLYRHKYLGHPIDLVIAAGNDPMQFLLRSRDEFWSGTPVVVCAVDERMLAGFTAPPGMVVITIRYDIEGTLRAALALLPDTRHVALVGGASGQDEFLHGLARQALQSLDRRLQLIDLIGLPVEAVLARVSALPDRTIVLVSGFQSDGAGRRFYGSEIAGSISGAANSPLFTVFGTVLGRGPVGGSMVDFEAVGREAGALALELLRGQPMPGPRHRSAASSALLFDGRQLDRWHMDQRRLPPGSRVLYREPGLWERYRWQVLGTLALVVVQSALIAGLLMERRRRRRIQAGLAEQLRFEALERDIAATLTDLSADRADQHVREGLRRIALFLEADRGTLWQRSRDQQTWSATHSWIAEGANPPPAAMMAGGPFLARLIEQGQGLCISDLGALPPGAEGERRALAQLGAKSLVAIPLPPADKPSGMLAFVSLRAERPWSEGLLLRLRTVAKIFTNALQLTETEAALASSEAISSEVLTALPGAAAILDHEGVIVQVNQTWSSLAGVSSAGCMAAMAAGVNYLDACRTARPSGGDDSAQRTAGVIEPVLRGSQAHGGLEYACTVAREDRWFEMRVERLPHSGGATVMHFDITKRKHSEAEARRHLDEMAHMDRVAGMAEIASSLAHEITQPLTAILSNAQTARRLLGATPPDLAEFRACVEDIIDDDHRAAEVIRRMRLMLRKSTLELSPANLNDLGKAVVNLVSNNALLQQVAIEFAPAPALPLVMGDPIQIQQVILNLLMNAITAAAAGPGARQVRLWTALADDSVELCVHDSGNGIDEQQLEQVFEPFFTTKKEGLGMGLAISRSIARAHGGRLWAENDPAGGAIFRLRLPIKPGDVA